MPLIGDADQTENTTRIVRQVAQGDRARFAELYERIAPSIVTWTRLRVPTAMRGRIEPEDVVQEVWLRALAAFDRYDQSTPFRGWVYRIVHNVMREAFRAASRHARETSGQNASSSVFDLGGLPDEATSLSERVSRNDALAAFLAKVESLPETDRELVVLRGLEGLPHDTVAEVLELNPAATRKRWSRLKEQLASGGPPDGLFAD